MNQPNSTDFYIAGVCAAAVFLAMIALNAPDWIRRARARIRRFDGRNHP